MLYYDRFDVSGGIDTNKTIASRVSYFSLMVFFK